MADNTILNTMTGGDTVRDIDRGAGAKTQVVQLDAGGGAGNAESLVAKTNPLPTGLYVINQVTGAVEPLYNGDNSNDYDAPAGVVAGTPTNLIGAEAYPRMFDGITWQRQRGQIDQGLRTYDTAVIELMTQVLTELRLHTVLMQQVFAISDDMNSLRNDVSITQQ